MNLASRTRSWIQDLHWKPTKLSTTARSSKDAGTDTYTFRNGLHSGAIVSPCLRSEAEECKEEDRTNDVEPAGELQGSGGYGV